MPGFKTYPRGTRGILTNVNSCVTFPISIHHADSPDYLTAMIEGSSQINRFIAEDWTFEADKPKLPTEDGYYVTSNHRPTEAGEVSFTAALFQLSNGKWSMFSSNRKADEAEAYAQEMLKVNGLTKVKLVLA